VFQSVSQDISHINTDHFVGELLLDKSVSYHIIKQILRDLIKK